MPPSVAAFSRLLDEDRNGVSAWAAFHVVEVMATSSDVAIRAFEIIERIAGGQGCGVYRRENAAPGSSDVNSDVPIRVTYSLYNAYRPPHDTPGPTKADHRLHKPVAYRRLRRRGRAAVIGALVFWSFGLSQTQAVVSPQHPYRECHAGSVQLLATLKGHETRTTSRSDRSRNRCRARRRSATHASNAPG